MAVQRLGDHLVAGAVGLAVGPGAQGCQQQAHDDGQQDGMAAYRTAQEGRHAARGAAKEQPREDAAQHAADDTAEPHPQGHVGHGGGAGVLGEVGVVALDGHENEAGGQHAQQHTPAPVQHHAAPQFLDGKDHAGQRSIEGGGQAAGGTGGHQFVGGESPEGDAVAAADIAPGQHDGRPDLHGGAFAAHRGADQHGQQCEGNLGERPPERDQPVLKRAVGQADGGDDLRDATAGHEGGVAWGVPGQGGQAQRQHDPGGQRMAGCPLSIPVQGEIGQLRKAQRGECHQRGTDQHAGELQALVRDAVGLAQALVQEVADAGGTRGRGLAGGGILGGGGMSLRHGVWVEDLVGVFPLF